VPAILTDPAIPAEDLRQRLYRGDLVILTKLRALDKFVDYMRAEFTELFAPHDPEHVHEHIEPAEMATILGIWKPRWIHAERTRELVRAIIAAAGFDPEYTHYDVPKPRTSFPSGHLTTGIAFAFPWHRDVCYGAPPSRSTGGCRSSGARDQRDEFRPGELRACRAEHLGRLRLLREQRPPPDHREVGGQGNQARPGAIDHAPSVDVIPLPARASAPFLRCAATYLDPELLGPGQVQRRLPHCQHQDLRPEPARRSWTPTAQGRRSGISSASRTRALSTRRRCGRSMASRLRTRCSSSGHQSPSALPRVTYSWLRLR